MKRLQSFFFSLIIFATISSVHIFAEEFRIDADFPGGNITVLGIDGDTVKLQQDLRDTAGNCFYWSFRIRGAGGRKLNFVFTGRVVGIRGPAVSIDHGLTWRWLGELGFSATEFQYQFGADDKDVYFNQGMNYTEKTLKRFLEKHDNNPYLKVESLCKTKKGRNVELLRIFNNDKTPEFKVFLSSRHHCAEMMPTYSLEGMIETVLKKRSHEYVHFVEIDPKEFGENSRENLQRFSAILEKERKGSIPYRASNNMPFGVSWNTAANKKTANLQKCDEWGATLPIVGFASAIEVPFANAEGAVVDADSARATRSRPGTSHPNLSGFDKKIILRNL